MSQNLSLSLDHTILQAVLDLLPGTLHVKDRDYRYCIVNRNYLERWGGTPEQVIGRTSQEAFGDFFGPGPDRRNAEVFATGKPLPFYEVTYPDKHGGSVNLWSTKVPIIDGQGVVTHVLTFSLDITPLKRAQAELERQRESLHQSERLSVLGTLAAGISHELRNPLSVVVAQAKLLEAELAADKARGRVNAIVRAAEHCAAIVRAFVDQSRSGPQKLEHFELAQIVDSALDLTQHVLKKHNVSLGIEHTRAGVTVEGDAHQLSQVVVNLVLNAVAAMQESAAPRKLVIRTGVNDLGDTAELTVSDTGPGVPSELRERIFERFFTTKAAGAGTGLGLAICREIISAHGGRISAEQSPREGALFWVRLPVSRRPETAAASATTHVSRAPRYRVLVVDDESEVAEVLRDILELAGHKVDVADSGESALARLSTAEYDVMLSDMRMPGMDGAMLYGVVCRRYPALSTRFALITGDMVSSERTGVPKLVGVPRISKPFDPRQITELVAALASP